MIRLCLCILIRSSFQFQGQSVQSAGELIELLRTDNAKDREEATRKLKAMGKQAQSALEAAAHDKDFEVVSRAKFLLQRLSTIDVLTPAILKPVPGVQH